MEQELLTLPEHLRSPPFLSGVRVTRSLVLYVCFEDSYLSFCTFSLVIVLSVLLRYTDSDCPFGIFKLFFIQITGMTVVNSVSYTRINMGLFTLSQTKNIICKHLSITFSCRFITTQFFNVTIFVFFLTVMIYCFMENEIWIFFKDLTWSLLVMY